MKKERKKKTNGRTPKGREKKGCFKGVENSNKKIQNSPLTPRKERITPKPNAISRKRKNERKKKEKKKERKSLPSKG